MQLREIRSVVLALVVAAIPSFAQQAPSARDAANYGRMPLTFEANHGQSGSQVKFLSRGKGYIASLTTGGLRLSLRPQSIERQDNGTQSNAGRVSTLQFKMIGAAKTPQIVGEDLQPGKVNYFIGNDPRQWRTNVPTYGQVRYKNLYPGIDLLFYGNQRQFEYDFEISPGSDPRRIQFEVQGAGDVSVDDEGDLVLTTPSRDRLKFKSPVVYQQLRGLRTSVAGRYVVRNGNIVAFEIGDYDPSKPLVVDPVLVYSTYIGGSGNDQPTGIAVDSAGSAYVVGYTDSSDFPLAAAGNLPRNTNHIFLAKLDPTGSHLVYADYIGGNSQDYGIALVLDSAKNVYLTGSTQSSDFPVVNAYHSQQPGPYTGFVTKVSADGSSLLYSTYLGGSTFDQPTSIAIDGSGRVHVAGYTMSQDFPVANANQSSMLSNQGGIYGIYGFLTQFSQDGSSLLYSTYIGGNSNVIQTCNGTPCWPTPYNAATALALDAAGNAYVAGGTNTYNFPTNQGAYLRNNGAPDNSTVGFVSKFSASGTLAYSTYFYGSSGAPVNIAAIAADRAGSAYITGNAQSDGTFPITSTGICDPSVYGYGCGYAFITKFAANGSSLVYSTFLGPNNYATPQSMALNANGNAYVLAGTYSNLLQGVHAMEPYSDTSDLLLTEIDAAGSSQLLSTYLGANGYDAPGGIALDSNGNVYIAGSTDSADFPITPASLQQQQGGGIDAFITKLGFSSVPAVSMTPLSLQYTPALSIGSTSQAQEVLLRNMSDWPLGITSISVLGDFTQTNTCGSGLSAASSCTLSITFAPTSGGTRTGSVVINDNAPGSPHKISLTGSALGAGIQFSPTALSFPGTQMGTSSSAQSVQLVNTGTTTVNISGVQITGDYGQTDNCPASLAVGSSCTFNVTFTPSQLGTRTGALTITDDAPGSPQSVALTGSTPDFSLSSSPTSVTLKAGKVATYSLIVAPVDGSFNSAINLACSGAPAHSSCSLSTSSVTPGSNSVRVTVTLTTSSASSAAMVPVRLYSNQMFYGFWMQLPAFGLFGIVVATSKRARGRIVVALALALMLGAMLLMSACAGGTGIAPGQGGTTPGTYTITVTGNSGNLQHSIPLILTVQ